MNTHRTIAILLALGWAFAVDDARAAAPTCHWSGTAPVCDGECREGETERYRADASARISATGTDGPVRQRLRARVEGPVLQHARYHLPLGRHGALLRGRVPRGRDGGGVTHGAPGASCWSGKKRYCCHSTGRNPVATGQQRLEAAPPKGVIYGLAPDHRLLWYRHDGRTDGSFRWAAPAAKIVGTGWATKDIFSGDDGVIYVVTPVVKATLPTGIGPGWRDTRRRAASCCGTGTTARRTAPSSGRSAAARRWAWGGAA